jgi:phosphoenolpyruvate carboxykinase (ATP)
MMNATAETIIIDQKEGVLDLWTFGQKNLRHIHRNLTTAQLYEHIIHNREGQIAHHGPVVVRSGDGAELPLANKYLVKAPADVASVPFPANQMDPDQFTKLLYRMIAYIQNKEIYVQYTTIGCEPSDCISVRFVTETAWHSLFVRTMYAPVEAVTDFSEFAVDFSVVHLPGFHADPSVDGIRSTAFVMINLSQKVIFICGTQYAGEIKQAVFSMLNLLVSQDKTFLMRCAANVGPDNDVAVFIGRGGSGKTTLAVDDLRPLIGDHVHGWTEEGLVNFERGGYAKVHNLLKASSPPIFNCTRRFGTILENVAVDSLSRRIDLADGQLTPNTRAAYPLSHVDNWKGASPFGHPQHLFLVTCDAFGVLPPLARLTPELAVYAFMCGYTSRLDKPETTEPVADFSFDTCFGASTMTLPAHVYGCRLLDKIKHHHVTCWMLNTGWTGEPWYHGRRIDVSVSRALIHAVTSGGLDQVSFDIDPVFGYEIPTACPGVPGQSLDPRKATHDEAEYEIRANQLAKALRDDFARFEAQMPEKMRHLLADVLSPDDSFDLLESMGFSI